MLNSAELDLFPPGVRLVGGRRRAPIRGVLHDVAGFVGVAERGPLDRAVRVASVQEFDEVFGGSIPQGFLAPSIRLFFENGGRAAWIVRVADRKHVATANVTLTMKADEGSEGPTVRFAASSPGQWGNRITLRIEPETRDQFTLRVAAPGRSPEIWPGLSALEIADGNRSLDGLSSRRFSIAEAPVAPASIGGQAGGVSVLVLGDPNNDPEKSKTGNFNGRRPLEVTLTGGRDGLAGLSAEDFGLEPGNSHGLALLESIDEVAVLAMPDLVWSESVDTRTPPVRPKRCEDHFARLTEAPTLTFLPDPEEPETRRPLDAGERARIRQEMVNQARRMGDRVVLVDCVHPSDMRRVFDDGEPDPAVQRIVDGEFAGLYYPWLETSGTGPDIVLPPSGAVAGIYARTTLQEGPHIAPANVPVEGATGVTYAVSDDEHAQLNAAHVNVIRQVPGRGLRPMGARTRRRDGPFRQMSIRRLVNFIVESLDEETQWLVFEPNDANLRIEVERAVRAFLDRLWRAGALEGARPDEAYSVSAGQDANPTSSIDGGRLVCELSVRVPWPVEWIRLRLVREDGGFQLAGVDTGLPPENTRET